MEWLQLHWQVPDWVRGFFAPAGEIDADAGVIENKGHGSAAVSSKRRRVTAEEHDRAVEAAAARAGGRGREEAAADKKRGTTASSTARGELACKGICDARQHARTQLALAVVLAAHKRLVGAQVLPTEV